MFASSRVRSASAGRSRLTKARSVQFADKRLSLGAQEATAKMMSRDLSHAQQSLANRLLDYLISNNHKVTRNTQKAIPDLGAKLAGA